MKHLTADDLKKMMLLSYERIEKEKESINKINVFPVPDQDTGSNMAKTLLGIKQAISEKEFGSVKELSEKIIDGALTNAQGNAGVIYTGFLAGFLPELGEKIDVASLGSAFLKGSERAKDSIQDPKQGTILDVISAASDAFKDSSEENIVKVFETAVENADKALLETREKMDILKKANVVDAGGMAFLMVLESFLESLKGKTAESKKKEKRSEKIKRFIQVISNRYEIVALVKDPKFRASEMKEKLKGLGNSIDLVGLKRKMKIHIHTDCPDDVKDVIRSAGQIIDLRTEDMAKEVAGEESLTATSVGIVTDSRAMLTEKIIQRYGIDIADQNNISDVFKNQLKRFSETICIASSSKLSKFCEAAGSAEDASSDPGRIFVVDSLNVGPGQALVVLRAIELIREHREADDVCKELEKSILLVKTAIVCSRKNNLYRIMEVKNGSIAKSGFSVAGSAPEALAKRIAKDSKRFKKTRVVIGYRKMESVQKIKESLKSKINIEVPFSGPMPEEIDSSLGKCAIIAGWTGING